MRRRRLPAVATLAILAAFGPAVLAAQEAEGLRVVHFEGGVQILETGTHYGFAAVPAIGFRALGWAVEGEGLEWRLRHPNGPTVELAADDPFFRWNGRVQQLVDAPYLRGGDLWIPVQLLLDFLPFHLPDRYRYAWGRDGEPELVLLDGTGNDPGEDTARGETSGRDARADEAPADAGPEPLVVIIDPGHGGVDLGAVGPGGTREKDVALALGLALARELRRHPGVEVHLTRESDVLVPLWKRGEWATEKKGEGSGVFLSLHANALLSRAARGFETYFLSEARTEHERRMAAIENEPLGLAEEGAAADTDLGFILNELRNLDHQHWSALLAELVQEHLDPVHPGPNRGVKQGPFAVITNALMPSVLVEVGFMSNSQEERLLGRPAFHDEVAGALAEAVVEFFRRYPPARGSELVPALPARD